MKEIYNMFKVKIIYIIIILLILFSCNKIPEQDLKNGDIIFQVSKSSQSKAIQIATGSKYSHMGIIYIENGKYFLYEAIQPVTLTPLNKWIKRGENSHFVVKRLKNRSKLISSKSIQKMKKTGEVFNKKNYDIYFGWSDESVYCSELVWKIYKNSLNIEIGELKKLKEFNLEHPVVSQKLHERYGENIPYNEPVISPGDMFDSELLETVEVISFHPD